jgi:hypothetical protein
MKSTLVQIGDVEHIARQYRNQVGVLVNDDLVNFFQVGPNKVFTVSVAGVHIQVKRKDFTVVGSYT